MKTTKRITCSNDDTSVVAQQAPPRCPPSSFSLPEYIDLKRVDEKENEIPAMNIEMNPPSLSTKQLKTSADPNNKTAIPHIQQKTPSLQKIDIMKQIYTYSQHDSTKRYNTKNTKQYLVDLNKSLPFFNEFPHPFIRDTFKSALKKVRQGYSTICSCEGLFAVEDMTPGYLGFYGGIEGTAKSMHAMEINGRIIVPRKDDPWSIFSLINEYIWDLKLNNVIIIAPGILYLTRPIKAGQEFLVHYGEAYEDAWISLRLQNEKDLSTLCLKIIQDGLFPNAPPLDDLAAILNRDTMPDPIKHLFHDFCRGNFDTPMITLHDFAPPPALQPTQWIEFVLRCRWTYSNFCFRRLHDPTGWRHPTPTIADDNVTMRRSCRISSKPCQRYGSDIDDVVPLIQLVDDSMFTYIYQPMNITMPIPSNDAPPDTPVDTTTHTTDEATSTSEETPTNEQPLNPSSPALKRSIHDVLRAPPNLNPCTIPNISPSDIWAHDVTPYTLRVGSLNVDGMYVGQYYSLFNHMELQQLDILTLIDTRQREDSPMLMHALNTTRHKYRVHGIYSTDKRYNKRVGGVMFICNDRICQPTIANLCKEGSTAMLNFHFGRKKMHVIATYWPIFNNTPGSLWCRLAARASAGHFDSPIDYLKTIIATQLTEFSAENQLVIVTGDFNSDVTKRNTVGDCTHDHYDLTPYTHATQLTHSSNQRQLDIQSYSSTIAHRHSVSTTSKGCTRIDYQFNNNCHILSTSCLPSDVMYDLQRSHRCLLGSYQLTEYTPKKRQRRYRNSIRDVSLKNHILTLNVAGDYKKLYIDMKPMLDDPSVNPTNKLLTLSEKSVKIVQGYTRRRTPHWNIYSPEAHANMLAIKYIRHMIKMQYGDRPNAWIKRSFPTKMKHMLKKWKTELKQHSRGHPDKFHELYSMHADCYGIQYWQGRTYHDTITSLTAALIATSHRLHASRRKSDRLQFSDHVRHMENERKQGRVRLLLNFIFRRRKKHCSLDYIIKNGEVITSDKEIAAACRDEFIPWFKALPDDDAQISNDFADWPIFNEPFNTFANRFTNSHIPNELIEILHTSIQQRPTPAKRQHLTDILLRPPTQAEFLQTLKKCKENSAPGVTGLSYNMIKLWPDDMHTAVFNILADLWTTYTIPAYWKDRMITLIPKSPLPNIDCFRPITLLETLRKLWTSITIRRITETIALGGYLHHSQHGCLKRVGVDEANLGLLNQFESARELTSELYTIAWDFKHAFDRPTKPTLLYAWLRIGVPFDIANYLVQLGIGGQSLIKSTLVTKAIIQKDSKTLQQQYFTQETGTSQGDNQAAISFNCVTDILLVALSNERLNPIAFSTHDGECIDQESSAYVDDITSLHGTIEGIQREADIISAYCQLFGFELSFNKLKAYRIQWGNAHILGANHIVIHSHRWTPHNLPLENDGSFKTLGMTVDADSTFHTQFEITKQNALTGINLILQAPVSAESKITALKISLFPKLMFAAKYAAWSLQQYQSIDTIIEHAYRKIAHCMASYPKALLYMKLDDGGLGLPKFSLACNICKLRLLMRMAQSNGYRRAITKSLLARGARSQGIVIPIGHGALINTPLQLVWVTSLLQELQERHLSMHIHGKNALQDIYYWKITPPNAGQLASQSSSAEIGISTKDEAGNTITAIPIRTAQVWEVTTSDHTSIKEIISYSGPYVEYMVWASTQPITIGRSLILSTTDNPISSYPVGAHGTHKSLYDDFFPPRCQTRLLILSAEKHDPDQLHITSKVKQIKLKTPIRMQPPHPSTTLTDLLQEIGQNALHIFTDGSFDPTHSPATGGGSVIFKMNDLQYTCVKIRMDLPCSSVFPIELCALAIARVAAQSATERCIIHSDSESSINVMTSIDAGEYQKNLLAFALNQPHLYSNRNLKWVKSHVEDRKGHNFRTWSDAEVGNYIADKMAGFQQDSCQAGPPIVIQTHRDITVTTVMVVNLSTIINAFMQYNSFSIRGHDQLFLGNLKDIHLADMCSKYLITRDAYRNKRRTGAPPRPHWALKSTNLLKWTNRRNIYLRENSLRSRIIYNKSWTTENQYKYGVTPNKQACPCCNKGLETQQHIIFRCSHPVMIKTRNDLIATMNGLIKEQITTHPKLASLIDFMREYAFDGKSIDLWTGLWSPRLRNTIISKLSARSDDGLRQLPVVAQLTRIYTDAAKEFYITRAKIRKDPDLTASLAGTHFAAHKITSYFRSDNKKQKKKKTEDSKKTQPVQQTKDTYLKNPMHNCNNKTHNRGHPNFTSNPSSMPSDTTTTAANTTCATTTTSTTITTTTTTTATTNASNTNTNSHNIITPSTHSQNITPSTHIVDVITENYRLSPTFQKRTSPHMLSLQNLSPMKQVKTGRKSCKRPSFPTPGSPPVPDIEDWFAPPCPTSPQPSISPIPALRRKRVKHALNEDDDYGVNSCRTSNLPAIPNYNKYHTSASNNNNNNNNSAYISPNTIHNHPVACHHPLTNGHAPTYTSNPTVTASVPPPFLLWPREGVG
jgi:ribonuclease HI